MTYSPSSSSSAFSTGLFMFSALCMSMSKLFLEFVGLTNSSMDLSILVLTGLFTSALHLSKLVLAGLFTFALGLSKLLLCAFTSSLRPIPSGLYQAAGVLSCMKSASRVWLPVWV